MRRVLISILFCYCAARVKCGNQETLELVQIVSRHGARTPFSSIPNDNHKDFWQDGIAELTNVGKMQMFNLGQFVRRRYFDFLNASNDNQDTLINSSSTFRTIASAECLMAGLYEPFGGQVWNQNMNWQPVPVFSAPLDIDYILNQDTRCPKADLYEKQSAWPQEMKKLDAENADFYEKIVTKAGFEQPNNNGILTVMSIYEVLNCQKENNLTWLSWVEPVWPKLKTLVARHFGNMALPAIARLRGGPLLGHLMDRMKTKISDKAAKLKAYFYVTHDKMMIALMTLLGVYNEIVPPTAAALILELHRTDDGQHAITILYMNTTGGEEPLTLTMRDCPTLCPLDKFASLMTSNIPYDVLAECGMTPAMIYEIVKPK